MSRYTPDSRDRVRDAVDMVALVESKLELRRSGVNSYFGCCPFHDERTASFHVRPDEKHYHCFGCSESGDPFDFVMATEGLDFKGALESLADRFGVTLETVDEDPEAAARRARRERLYSLLTRTATFYERMLWESREGQPARDYLVGERGLDADVLRRFRVGWSPDAWDRVLLGSRRAGFSDEEMVAAGLIQRSRKDASRLYDRFRAQIMFPTTDARGRVIGFGGRKLPGDSREWLGKYINTAEGEIYSKRAVLYGINEARGPAAKAGRMVLAEGYTDVIALHQAGVTNAVGIMGTSLTKEQVSELVRLVGTLELCLDADSAGQDAMARAAQLCAETGLELRVVALPSGADPGELIKTGGAAALADQVTTSVPYVVFEVQRTLGRSDLGSAEGKDRAISALAPALARVPQSVLRDELLGRIAGAMGIADTRLAALLDAAGSGGGHVGPPPSRGAGEAPVWDRDPGPVAGEPPFGDGALRGGPSAGGGALRVGDAAGGGVESGTVERGYLTLCIAAGEAGRSELLEVEPERLLSSAVLRQAAHWIAGQIDLTVDGVDEREVSGAIDGLESDARARQEADARAGRSVDPQELAYARLLLDLRRIDRDMRAAVSRRAGVIQLAREKHAVQAEIGVLVGRLQRQL